MKYMKRFLQRTFQFAALSHDRKPLAILNASLIRLFPNNRPISTLPPANLYIHVTLPSYYISPIPPFHFWVRQSHLQQHFH